MHVSIAGAAAAAGGRGLLSPLAETVISEISLKWKIAEIMLC